MYIVFVLLLILLILLGLEKFYLDSNVKKLKIRILVNGTRGKSTVVKYIATLLRENNYNTFSKITGVVPTFFKHDDEPVIIKRRGTARVTEQLKMIGKAARLSSDAIVLECMSINPELQKLESRLLRPHFYVITNIREDHLEDMGKTPDEWVHSICSAIPADTIVITAEKEYLETIKSYAAEVNSKVISVENLNLSDKNFDKPGIVKENVRLALAVGEELKLDSSKFSGEIIKASGEEENYLIEINKYNVSFYNGFAVNDVPSAQLFLNKVNESNHDDRKFMIIFNSRADRPMRSLSFAEMINNASLDKCILTGDHKQATRRKLISLGMEKEKIIQWKTKHCLMFNESLTDLIDTDTILIGLGNIKGDGFEIINSLNKN